MKGEANRQCKVAVGAVAGCKRRAPPAPLLCSVLLVSCYEGCTADNAWPWFLPPLSLYCFFGFQKISWLAACACGLLHWAGLVRACCIPDVFDCIHT